MSLFELTRPLRAGIAHLRRRVRSLLLVLGISRVVTLLVVALTVFFFADYFLQLPLAVRRILAVGVAAGLAFAFYAKILRPLSRPLHDQMLAGHVEAAHPELMNRLSSSLAFCQAENDPENEDSPELMRAVVEQTAGMAGSIRFTEVARSRTTSRWAGAAVTLLFAMTFGAVARADLVATFVQLSLLLRDIPWPRRTTLSVVDMRPGEPRRVTRGRETTIQVRAEGSVPDTVRMTWWERGKTKTTIETMDLTPTAEDASLFSMTMPVYASYEFRLSGGDDDRGLIYVVEALTPPGILRVEMDCSYPEYLGKPAETLVNGDQRVPEGTAILLRIQANMPLESARISFNKGSPAPMTRVAEDTFSAPIETSKDVRYALLLSGPNGEENDASADSFVLRVVKDQAPLLRVRTPNVRTERVDKGVVLFAFTARDDYRVATAQLKYRINDKGKERTVALGESGGEGLRLLEAPRETAEFLSALAVLDLARLRTDDGKPLGKGDTLHCHVEATDSAGKTQRTRADYQITVVDDDRATQQAENLRNTLTESSDRTIAHAATAREDLDELRARRGKDASEFRRWGGRAQASMGRLISDLDGLARRIRGVLNVYVFNRLDGAAAADQMLPYYERHLLAAGEESRSAFAGALYREIWAAQQERAIRAQDSFAKLIEMADLSDRLAVDHAPAAYKALGLLNRSTSDNGEALDSAVREGQIIAEGLARLERLMAEWQSYEGVLRFFQHMRDRQRGFSKELEGINTAEKSGD